MGLNGAAGLPVNCWTMALKLVASVLSRVVGVRREALERLRTGFDTRPASGIKLLFLDAVVSAAVVGVMCVCVILLLSGNWVWYCNIQSVGLDMVWLIGHIAEDVR